MQAVEEDRDNVFKARFDKKQKETTEVEPLGNAANNGNTAFSKLNGGCF